MKKIALVLGVVLAAAAWAAADAPQKDVAQAYEKFKSLEGRWEGTNAAGKKTAQVYEVVSGGKAVLERNLEEDADHSNMITMFHLDSGRLLLTHYCAAGNQPRMRLDSYDPATQTLVFEFQDATNLASPNAGHMHRAVYKFPDRDRFVTEWTYWRDGKPAFTESSEFRRVKDVRVASRAQHHEGGN